MEDRGRLSKTMPILLTVAALVVIIAGMRAARELVVPFLGKEGPMGGAMTK